MIFKVSGSPTEIAEFSEWLKQSFQIQRCQVEEGTNDLYLEKFTFMKNLDKQGAAGEIKIRRLIRVKK